jgi:uncharacterized membrane protein YesL
MAYDHLGGLVVFNLLWGVLNLPWLALALVMWNGGPAWGREGVLVGFLLAVELVFLSPVSLLLYLVGREWARQREIGVAEVLRCARHFFVRAQLLQLLVVATTAILLLNVVFYRDFSGWLGLFLSGVMAWLLLALAVVAVQLLPLLVTQDGPVWQTIKQALLLTVDNIVGSFALLLAACAFCALGIVTGIGVFCGFTAGFALFASVYYQALLSKYSGKALPEEKRRGLRELIRPWEG